VITREYLPEANSGGQYFHCKGHVTKEYHHARKLRFSRWRCTSCHFQQPLPW